MGKLCKNEIINLVSEEARLTKRDAKAAVDATFEIIQRALINGEEVNIKNFATFKTKTNKERMVNDFLTHEKVKRKENKSAKVKFSKEFIEQLNKTL